MRRSSRLTLRWSAILAAVAIIPVAVGLTAAPSSAHAEVPNGPLPGIGGTPFSDGGAWIYNYVKAPEPYDFMDRHWDYPATKYSSITEKIDNGYYSERGISNMVIYGPYASTGEWRGLPATGDLMDIDPANGTLSDWREMVTAANNSGMTITAYLALLYVDSSSPIFKKAEEDRRDGVDSWQRRLFLWDDRDPEGADPKAAPPSAAQIPRPSEGDWAYSTTAGRWYATTWGLPALNYASSNTMDFAKQVMRFWMDNGVQGFEFDAPQSMWGFQNGGDGLGEARNREFVTYPQEYRPDWQPYTHAEGSGTYANQAFMDRVGYTHIMVNPDDDFDSFVSRIGRYPQANTPDDLERHYESFVDQRRLLGRGTYAPAVQDLISMPPGLRALDLAVQGGNGVIVSIDQQILLDALPEPEVDSLFDVTRALAASPAEAPSASRTRVPTNVDSRAYAVMRRSTSGDQAALNVYNFHDTGACVTLNLEGSGIKLPQRTTNLLTGQPGPWIRSEHQTITLPAYGWLFLDVDSEPDTAWKLVDSAAPGWTYGGGWATTTDPSAYGGSFSGGTQQGGFGEYTFTGSTVQGWGRATSNGSTDVEVFVDGISHGIHSERQAGSGGPFQGTQFFSITGLSNGPHTLRIQQNDPAGESVDGSSIDYLKVASTDIVTPSALPQGDSCAADTTAPTSAATIAHSASGSVTAAITSSDDLSGVATVEYQLNGGAWTEYVNPIQIVSPGEYSLQYRATDVAGNIEAPKSIEFEVAAPPPGGSSGGGGSAGSGDPSASPAPTVVPAAQHTTGDRLAATGSEPLPAMSGGAIALLLGAILTALTALRRGRRKRGISEPLDLPTS